MEIDRTMSAATLSLLKDMQKGHSCCDTRKPEPDMTTPLVLNSDEGKRLAESVLLDPAEDILRGPSPYHYFSWRFPEAVGSNTGTLAYGCEAHLRRAVVKEVSGGIAVEGHILIGVGHRGHNEVCAPPDGLKNFTHLPCAKQISSCCSLLAHTTLAAQGPRQFPVQ